ncbi:hypothetical protein Srot_2712 [Segniliparus rotundus DSM 44985]|uniref:Uncharacterized protein n=1 Tax=Segniliparus rotundus (strain ATCC BAA-972 / CDC 1076 / CIP 108378 / DSM 44985 / JCM 13578) TaxID=640132 RepID=D6ZCV9_SEGRD|nr:hypothetical protein Srot_2712 [Segniliparus rotundus DSM 44985]
MVPGGGASSSAASSAPSVDPAVAAQKAACAAFRDAVTSANTANQTFFKAIEDPKRGGVVEYDKPITDAANAAAVIFMYASDQIDGAVTPQVPKDLANKLGDFVQILQERARLYAQHAGTDKLDPNGDKYTPAAKDLLKACPAGSSDASPPKLPVASASSPDAAKQAFCGVYSKQIQNTEDAITRFGAATKGDEHHPDPQWDDPDQWLTGQAQDSGIIFKYAANTLEASISPELPPDIAEKAKSLVAGMRKLGGLYTERKSTDAMKAAVHEPNGYGPSADSIDTLCGIA